MNKKINIEICILLLSVTVFVISIFNIDKLNLIFVGLGQLKPGWNVLPPASALDSKELQNSIAIDPKLILFESALFILTCYLSIDIYRKIQKD